MVPPHLFCKIYSSLFEQNDYTSPYCDKLSECTDCAHTEVEDLSLRRMNESNVCDQYRYDTRQFYSPVFIPIILPSKMNIVVDWMFKIHQS